MDHHPEIKKIRIPKMDHAWKIIGGYGAHIKSTRDLLIIQQKGGTEEVELRQINHLLIAGGHHIQTSTINSLINRGIFISFCESDGEPVGFIQPYGDERLTETREVQRSTPGYSIAHLCAKGAIQDRILSIESWNELQEEGILFAGELDILDRASKEIDNLVRIEEIRRVDRLVSDMYYEILSRKIPPIFGFKRKTERPYKDPINAILSYGYGILSSACTRSLAGSFLDPDIGFLNRGRHGLSLDLINCWKTDMIDRQVIGLIGEQKISPDTYECTSSRCILSENLMKILIRTFQNSIKQEIIDTQVLTLYKALKGEIPFQIHRYHSGYEER